MLHRRRFSGHHKKPSVLGSHGASLYLMCVMMLFWTMSEGIVSFIAPLKIEEVVMSDTLMGLILGSSSVAGALFDLIACRLFKDTYYKRIFAGMFALCLLFPLILMNATVPIMFVLGMIVCGVYFDLRNIGSFDYIARTTTKADNAHNFGMIQVFQSIGWVLGPIIVGFLVGEKVGWEPFAAIYIFLGIAFACFLGLIFSTKKRTEHKHKTEHKECRRGVWSEARILGQIGRVLFPALVLIFFLNFTDAFFWSIGPLFAEEIGLGYVFGPILAGLAADMLGYNMTFGLLGLLGAATGLILILTQGKRVNMKRDGPPLICDA